MEKKSKALPAIIYYLIGLAVLALTFKSVAVIAVVCTVSAGFLFAGSRLWDNGVYIAIGLAAVIFYLRTGSLAYTFGAAVLLGSVVLMLGYCVKSKLNLTYSVGVTVIVTASLLMAVFIGYVYISRGSLDFTGIFEPLNNIKGNLDELLYQPLMSLATASRLTAEEASAYVSDILTAKNEFVDAMLAVLPGLAASGLIVSVCVTRLIARALLGRKNAELFPYDKLTEVSIPRPIGVFFLGAFFISIFADGMLASVLNNLLTALELPFLFTGALTVYFFFARFSRRRGSRVLTAILVIITALGIPISLAVAYIIIGAADSVFSFRKRLKDMPSADSVIDSAQESMQDFSEKMADMRRRAQENKRADAEEKKDEAEKKEAAAKRAAEDDDDLGADEDSDDIDDDDDDNAPQDGEKPDGADNNGKGETK